MKTTFLLLLIVAGVVLPADAQYNLEAFSINGGGGTSSGGVYTLSGSIGQPEAGQMSGGAYTLVGGFWGVISTVESTGAPPLRISVTAAHDVIISWPSAATGFTLQQNPTLGTANWIQTLQTPTDDGTTKSIVVNRPTGTLFYRLAK